MMSSPVGGRVLLQRPAGVRVAVLPGGGAFWGSASGGGRAPAAPDARDNTTRTAGGGTGCARPPGQWAAGGRRRTHRARTAAPVPTSGQQRRCPRARRLPPRRPRPSAAASSSSARWASASQSFWARPAAGERHVDTRRAKKFLASLRSPDPALPSGGIDGLRADVTPAPGRRVRHHLFSSIL